MIGWLDLNENYRCSLPFSFFFISSSSSFVTRSLFSSFIITIALVQLYWPEKKKLQHKRITFIVISEIVVEVDQFSLRIYYILLVCLNLSHTHWIWTLFSCIYAIHLLYVLVQVLRNVIEISHQSRGAGTTNVQTHQKFEMLDMERNCSCDPAHYTEIVDANDAIYYSILKFKEK